MNFTNLKIVNTVFYFDTSTNINVFEIFEMMPISNDFVTGMKLRNQKKGDAVGKNFKNSLHVNILGMSLKIFSNGKIHISGNKDEKEINSILLSFFIYCKKIQKKNYKLNYYSEDSFYKYNNWYIGKYNGKIVKRIVEIENKLILVPEEIFLIKEKDHFLSNTHIKNQTIYNNLGSISGSSRLEMISRKNLPKKTSYYSIGNEYFLKYRNQKFGELKRSEIKNEEISENELVSTVIFDKKIKISKHVININTVFKIISNQLNKNFIYDYFYEKKYIVFYNPDKYPAVKCNFYLDENNQLTNTKTKTLIKVQFHDYRINISSKNFLLADIVFKLLKEILNENESFIFKKNENKKISKETNCWTIHELYDLYNY